MVVFSYFFPSSLFYLLPEFSPNPALVMSLLCSEAFQNAPLPFGKIFGIQSLQDLYPLYPSKPILLRPSSHTFKLPMSAKSQASLSPPERPPWLSDCKIPQLLHAVGPPCSFLAPCGSHSYTASLSLKRRSSLHLPSLLSISCLVLVIAKLFISTIRKQDPRDWGSRIIHDDVCQGACPQTYVPLNRRQGRGSQPHIHN